MEGEEVEGQENDVIEERREEEEEYERDNAR